MLKIITKQSNEGRTQVGVSCQLVPSNTMSSDLHCSQGVQSPPPTPPWEEVDPGDERKSHNGSVLGLPPHPYPLPIRLILRDIRRGGRCHPFLVTSNSLPLHQPLSTLPTTVCSKLTSMTMSYGLLISLNSNSTVERNKIRIFFFSPFKSSV